jgi:hypothetical protein
LVRAFWTEIDFRFAWCRFRFLDDAPLAAAAAAEAARAELVLFVWSSEGDLPLAVRNWGDSWAEKRPARASALVALSTARSVESAQELPASQYLRSLARRAGMDFLASREEGGFDSVPEVMRQMERRANDLSQVLENLLRRPLPPPPPPSISHWGINE